MEADVATLETVLKLVKELGFPTFMCLWLMWQSMRRDKEHTTALQNVAIALRELDLKTVAAITKVLDGVDDVEDLLKQKDNIVRLPLPKIHDEGGSK